MYVVTKDLIGFIEIHNEHGRVAMVNQWEKSLEEDEAIAREIVNQLNQAQ